MKRISCCCWLLSLLALALPLSGCGPREYRLPETGATLEGKVTYAGKPVPAAMIIVAGESGGATGNIGEDGRFLIPNVPVGAVKLAVNTDAAKGQMIGQNMAQAYQASKEGKKAPAPRFLDVPKKYHDPNASGLTTTIKEGVNTFDIVLQ
jgi:hypothetical protein